jgi:predicted lipoprotein with Yx(FWY)xxD motif
MHRAFLLTLLLTSAAYAEDAAPALPAGFTVQESTIGQTVRYSDPTQYSSGKLERSPGVRVLADFRGMSVYTFDGDKRAGKSTCVGECLRDWQPLAAPLMAAPNGDWSVVRRDDGSPQWAYKGRPLYTFTRDAKAGDTHGEGVGGLWHVARP